MASTFPAASTSRHTYTPTTYPLSSTPTLAVHRLVDGEWTAVTMGAVTADATNEAYYADLASANAVAGLHRFTWALTLDGQVRTDVEYAVCTEGEPVVLLATPGDLMTFRGAITGWEKLVQASARVRRYAKQTISAVDDDVVTLLDGQYLLPQRPVRSVTSVVDEDGTTLVDGTDYEVVGSRIVTSPRGRLTVTYNHGFSTIPEALVEVVCSVAYRLSTMPSGLAQGNQIESGDGEFTTRYGMEAYIGVTGLLAAERQAIAEVYPRLPRSVDTL